MFQLVTELKLNEKYKIMATYEFRGFYEGSVEMDTLLKFGNLYNVTMNISYFYPSRQFYAFVSDQPQWKMERRAVNLIVAC